jgi:DNA (cytosine-5)-methyltransferase 1
MQVIDCEIVWHFEVDKYASQVLDARWPGVPNYGDITSADFCQVEPVDVLTAGYPCQPFSFAGKQLGEFDERHLWPSVASAIRQLRPRHVLLENVAGHLVLGFGTVLGDLAALGYDARWVCLRAADAGAPHNRARVFVLAAADADWGRREQRDQGQRVVHVPDEGHSATWGPFWPAIARWERLTGRPAPSPLDDRGRLNPALSEWMMGLDRGWVTDVPISRTQQLKIIGNGVVPQQAALALRTLLPVAEAVAA